MNDGILEAPLVRMPELAPGTWLNVAESPSRSNLRGRVILIDFWDYTCVNCLRTLPYLRQWHERYSPLGLFIVGVHAPEFAFARDRAQVQAAIESLGVTYPVLLDNDFKTWERFANRAWPSKYLVDTSGYIRYRRRGEGGYHQTEQAIQALLRQRDQAVPLPALMPPLRPEDASGAVCYRPTPELHAGYRSGGLMGSALGNPTGATTDTPLLYQLPPAAQRRDGRFYAAGFWRLEAECLVFAGQEAGEIVLPYQAAGVNVVMSPSSDPVALMLDLRPAGPNPVVELLLDGAPLPRDLAGRDVRFDPGGHSVIQVDRPRMYELVRHRGFAHHELRFRFRTTGLAIYAFSFTTCLTGGATNGAHETLIIP